MALGDFRRYKTGLDSKTGEAAFFVAAIQKEMIGLADNGCRFTFEMERGRRQEEGYMPYPHPAVNRST
jgi:hypothetical protein